MANKMILTVAVALTIALMVTPSEAALKVWIDGNYQKYVGAFSVASGVCVRWAGKSIDNQVSSLEAANNELWLVYQKDYCGGPSIPVGNCFGKILRMSQTTLGNDKISSVYRVL